MQIKRKIENISVVVAEKLCISCGMCYSICPKNAISIWNDFEGQPRVSDECNMCGLCLKACPGMTPLMAPGHETRLGPFLKCHLGYSKDKQIRQSATSGGIITGLSLYLLENKGIDGIICIKQKENNIYRNEPVLAKTRVDVISAKGSRYAPAYVCSGLKDLPLKTGGSYCFVGKPCDIQALEKAGKFKERYNILTIGLFCARTPSMKATKEVIHRYGVDEKELKNIEYRGNGWPGYFHARSKDGIIVLAKPYHEVWNNILCQARYFSKRCMLCHDCTSELADISVGDAWLQELMQDSDGHSVVIERSSRGVDVIRDAIDNGFLSLEDTDEETVARSQASLLSKKKNIALKRLMGHLFMEKMPVENATHSILGDDLLRAPGIAKYFVQKKFYC